MSKHIRLGLAKPQAQVKLNLVRGVKGNKKGFYRYHQSEGQLWKTWACWGMAMKTWWEQTPKKAEVSNAFISNYASKTNLQQSQGPWDWWVCQEQGRFALGGGRLGWRTIKQTGHAQGPEGTNPWELKEPVTSSQGQHWSSWKVMATGRCPGGLKKANIPIFKKDPGKHRSFSLTSSTWSDIRRNLLVWELSSSWTGCPKRLWGLRPILNTQTMSRASCCRQPCTELALGPTRYLHPWPYCDCEMCTVRVKADQKFIHAFTIKNMGEVFVTGHCLGGTHQASSA